MAGKQGAVQSKKKDGLKHEKKETLSNRSKYVTAVLTLMVALLAGQAIMLLRSPRATIPEHLLGNKVVFEPELLSAKRAEQLLALSKEMGKFPTNSADLKFYDTLHEHIGEAEPIGADGRCHHPFLVPSKEKNLCVLPGRVDVARHFIMAGGVEGLKERYEDSASRLQSFGRYIFNVSAYPVVDELFASPKFQQAALAVCPSDKQYLDPFQFNFIVQVPGQTVALHLDAPYFWGASRFEFPQWLLVSMVFSNLFHSQFVDQIQVVGYYHGWNDSSRAGDFVYWDSNDETPKRMGPVPLSGNIVDGSKTVHAATVYMPHLKPPKMDKSAESELRYVAGEKWQVISNGVVLKEYTTDDLRFTIVYRARCFKSKENAKQFANLPDGKKMKLDEILKTFKADLVKRGKLTQQEANTILPLDLAIAIMETYVAYPLPPKELSLFPYNYCALPKLFPGLESYLDYFFRFLC